MGRVVRSALSVRPGGGGGVPAERARAVVLQRGDDAGGVEGVPAPGERARRLGGEGAQAYGAPLLILFLFLLFFLILLSFPLFFACVRTTNLLFRLALVVRVDVARRVGLGRRGVRRASFPLLPFSSAVGAGRSFCTYSPLGHVFHLLVFFRIARRTVRTVSSGRSSFRMR